MSRLFTPRRCMTQFALLVEGVTFDMVTWPWFLSWNSWLIGLVSLSLMVTRGRLCLVLCRPSPRLNGLYTRSEQWKSVMLFRDVPQPACYAPPTIYEQIMGETRVEGY